jgi:DNA polymerase III delta prime subunit
MFTSLYDQIALTALLRHHLTPTLGKKAVKQIIRAIEKNQDWFNRTIIEPRVFNSEFGGSTYYPLATTAKTVDRNHGIAQAIAADDPDFREFKPDLLGGVALFANALCVSESDTHDETQTVRRPSERVVLDDHHIFTFEFDVADPAFLGEQLSWLRSSKNPLDCRMGAFFRYLSGFADFRGLTVCWSGHKSLHIHVVFATDLARVRLRLDRVGTSNLRAGLIAHWERLEPELLRILGVQHHRPDPHLKYPESYRPLPNGGRLIEVGHKLGLPEGIHIPQVTLWERARERAGGDDLPLFFTAEPFQADLTGAATRSLPKTKFTTAKKLGNTMSADEVAYCEDRLREWFSGWPRFDHLTFEGGRWVAKFRNSANDRTPSSVMREDYSTIHPVGRDAEGLAHRPLEFPLGFMLRVWCGQLAEEKDRLDAAVSFTEIMNGDEIKPLNPFERRFRERVHDAASAAWSMRHLILSVAPSHECLLISGPEGVGKTSVAMAEHRQIVRDLGRRGDTMMSMYAFASYEAAEDKCADFNRMNAATRFIGIVLPSFGRMYEKACSHFGIAQISAEDAARRGFKSRMDAIVTLQPKVRDYFREQHKAMWGEIGSLTPVFFTVHQVAHDWRTFGPTRLMSAPSRWDEPVSDKVGHRRKLRQETTLGLLVHDEVKVESLVEMQPEAVMRWVEDLVRSNPTVWKRDGVGLSDAWKSYNALVQQRGMPVIDEHNIEIGFEDARRLAAKRFSEFDHVVTIDSGEYEGRTRADNDNADEEEQRRRDIYGCRHGRDWMIAPRGWWRGVAKRVILLTTEAVPTAVARAADPSFAIYDLEAPLAGRDEVQVHASRFVRGDNLARLCAEFRAERPEKDFKIVSNRAAMLEGSMSHASARGSNDLIGQNVVQTMTFMTPDEYEMMQALNAWAGRRDLVGLRHIDEFNQSAGRNLGFRRRGQPEHHLLVHRRLFDLLVNSPAQVMGRPGTRCGSASTAISATRSGGRGRPATKPLGKSYSF